MTRGMAAPGQTLLRVQYRQGGRRPVGEPSINMASSMHYLAVSKSAAKVVCRPRLPTSRAVWLWVQPGQPRQAQRQQIAALYWVERVWLIDNNRVERGKIIIRFGPAEHQRQLLGRGQQNIGRVLLLPGFDFYGVSPLRVSMLISSANSSTGCIAALDIDSQGL